MEDTIVAIATTIGYSALNIIKISGKNAIKIVNEIFKGKDLTKVNSHTINYGFIVDKEEKIDEVLVSIFKAPKTYTREDVVEINCHGGIIATNKILELILNKGIRLAEPGEFLKRAFLNGRIDLIEAESVQDLINAKTDQARILSLKGIEGTISKQINELREEILSLIANIEVNIDYPEYEDATVVTKKLLKEKIKQIKNKLEKILKGSENGKIIKNGIKVGIIGRPNVGKSSLLNALIEENKAIVTNIAGTTRDIVEGSIILDGIELNLVDTAGIRKTSNIVERIGVDKSYEIIEESDLILVVLDNNQKLNRDDKAILEKSNQKKLLVIINKTDLERKLDVKELEKYNIVETSIANNKGIKELKEKIKELFNLNQLKSNDYTYLSNARQISLVKECLNIIKNIESSLKNDVEVDLIEIDIRKIWDLLGEIIGKTYKDELLDEIFSKFCLGK